MPGDSHFWSGLMNIKPDFLSLGRFQLGNGAQVRFWEDTWLGNLPFKCQYPGLYNIVRKKSASVSTVFRSNPLNVAFRRSLVDNNLRQWQQLVARVVDVQLHDRDDRFIWSLHQNGMFTVRSMYRALTTNEVPHHHVIRKPKIPLKIKVFIWYLLKGVTLTKDNLARRQWKGSVRCCFCNLDETIQHLFFDCPNAKFIWRLVQVEFNLPTLLNVNDIWTNWLNEVNKKLRYQAWVGACATLWAIWLSRNDVVFNKAQVYVVFNKAQVFSSL